MPDLSAEQPRVIRADEYAFAFDGKMRPLAVVGQGELLEIHTDDAFCSGITEKADLPSTFQVWPYVNPQTGPVHVKGAKPGDTLRVEIISIEPSRPFAVSAHIPNFGGLVASDNTPLLNDPIPEEAFVYPIENGTVRISEHCVLPYQPFLGTITAAPLLEVPLTTVPGRFGGNMDVHDTCPGNTVYLPIAVEGGAFFVGDAHANQGDGEITGVALEMSAIVRLRLFVERGQKVPGPMIESPDRIMCVGTGKPLEEAAREAYVNLIRLLQVDYGMTRSAAYQLVAHAGRARIGNFVDPRFAVCASLEKKYLPPRAG